MQDSLRKSYLPLTLFGALAVAASVATYKVTRTGVLIGAQLALTDSGTGAGNTSVVVKKNGTAITPTLSVAGAAASPNATTTAMVNSGASPYPAGTLVQAGDVITVDITALPATTSPKAGTVYLDYVQIDT